MQSMHLSQDISVFESSRSSWLGNTLQQICEVCWVFSLQYVQPFPFWDYSPHCAGSPMLIQLRSYLPTLLCAAEVIIRWCFPLP